MMIRLSFADRLFVCALCLTLACGSVFAQRRNRGGAGNDFGFRFLGPINGNRVSAVAGIPGDPSTWYAGAASGGVWKSTDGGNRLEPHLRRRARRGYRCAGRRAFRSQCRVGGHGRSLGHPRYRRDGRRRLQIHGRRQDLDPYGARRHRPHRPHRRSIRRTATACTSALSAA